MKVLIAEDDPVTAKLVERILQRSAHTVTVTTTGLDALARLRAPGEHPYEVLLTDWMMPGMDGIELIRRVRAEVKPAPMIIMATAIDLPTAKEYALRSGADGFLAKPVGATELLPLLEQAQGLASAQRIRTVQVPKLRTLSRLPSFVGVAIAASTGGPDALRALFRAITPSPEVAYFVVIHGPAWMQHSCAELFQKEAPTLRFVVATHGTTAVGGTVYLAPGDKHLVVTPGSFTLALTDDPLVNFVRPAADPLFHSVAAAFDRYSVGVVLTGFGVDGAHGAGTIAAAGGRVLIQDPATAVAPPMPEAARRTVSAATVVPLVELGGAVSRRAREVVGELHAARG